MDTVVRRGVGGGGGKNWEVGISMCTAICTTDS